MKSFLITIDNIQLLVKPYQKTIYHVFSNLYTKTSHFCYNKKLAIAGNCRMCLVEIKNIPKPIVSCATPVIPNQVIFTKTAFTLKARENVLEFILLNHPLDCPVCDQGGECDLQEFSLDSGSAISRFFGEKKTVSKKKITTLIYTSMNKCINCTKCLRVAHKIGLKDLILVNRSKKSEIFHLTSVSKKKDQSEFSSKLIEMCPVIHTIKDKALIFPNFF